MFSLGFFLNSFLLGSNINNKDDSTLQSLQINTQDSLEIDSFLSNETNKLSLESLHLKSKVNLYSEKPIKYNPNLFQILSDIFPNVIAEEIVEYNHAKHLQEIYDKVMNKLDLLKEERDKLDFYSKDFLIELASITERKKNKFARLDLFWMDLRRLLFKNILYLKQEKLIDATKDEFKKASIDIYSLDLIIWENTRLYPPLKLDLENINLHDFGHDLLNSEFFEHSDHLAARFVHALEYFYSPLINKGQKLKDGEEITCEKFKAKFFENGNLDTDILLKFFMIHCDIRGRLLKACLESNTQPDYSKIDKESIEEIKNDINQLRGSKGIRHFINIPGIRHANNSIMNFVYLNNIKISIVDKIDLYQFLQRMKETGLLQREKIEKITIIRNLTILIDQWDLGLYESLLRKCDDTIFLDIRAGFDFVNECLKLFDLPPF